jgi:DNA-binding winged helix-turn-helix (wHTH) protein
MIPMVAGCFSFGPFHIDTTERALRRDGILVVLAPKAFEILTVLVQSSGRVVSKEELIQAVWPDTFVEENNLTVHISALRKSLDEGLIETIPRRGYRFTGSVSQPPPALLIHEVTRTDIVVEDVTPPSRRAWITTAAAGVAAVLGGAAYMPSRFCLSAPLVVRRKSGSA